MWSYQLVAISSQLVRPHQRPLHELVRDTARETLYGGRSVAMASRLLWTWTKLRVVCPTCALVVWRLQWLGSGQITTPTQSTAADR